MARKSSKKIRKPAPRAKRAAKAKSLVAASESVRRERGRSAAQVTKRAVKTKPLTAASALVRHERDRKQPDAKVAVMAPLLAPGFSMMDTMKRFSMTNVEHIARLVRTHAFRAKPVHAMAIFGSQRSTGVRHQVAASSTALHDRRARTT
jgi:hypothetical protein